MRPRPTPAGRLSATLRRWATENLADTRREDGPEGRVYAVPFATVWDALLGWAGSRRGWTVRHRDEELGLISITCRSPVLRFVDDLTIWVALDENGLTTVEALSRSRSGRGDLGANRRRIERLLRALDRAVGLSGRLVGDAAGRSTGMARGTPRDRPTPV